jgi:hypothetical protein
MKKFYEKYNEISSKRFLEKFLSKRTKQKEDKKNKINENIEKTPIKRSFHLNNNSNNWIDSFSEKKKNKYYNKAREDINKVISSRNINKKFLIYNNCSKVSSMDFQKKNFTQSNSLEKNNLNKKKFIKETKEELKKNNDKYPEKKIEKNKNLKVKRVFSEDVKRKIYSSSFNYNSKSKNNINNLSKNIISSQRINTDNNINKKINSFNKFMSDSNFLKNNEKLIFSTTKQTKVDKLNNNNSNIKSIKKNHIKKSNSISVNNSNLLFNNSDNNDNINNKKNNTVINDIQRIYSYKNKKIKKIEIIKSTKLTNNINQLVLTNSEILNRLTQKQLLYHLIKNKKLKINEKRPNSLTEMSSSHFKNKYRDLIIEYELEIDS